MKKFREELEQFTESKDELKKKADVKRAAVAIEESLQIDNKYQNTIKQAIGEDKFRKLLSAKDKTAEDLLELIGT